MDPNACMQRILNAIKAQDKYAAEDALEDLIEWLEKGGFAPRFTSEMAGKDRFGNQRRVLRFKNVSIQTVHPADDRDGWELVCWTYLGDRRQSWKMEA